MELYFRYWFPRGYYLCVVVGDWHELKTPFNCSYWYRSFCFLEVLLAGLKVFRVLCRWPALFAAGNCFYFGRELDAVLCVNPVLPFAQFCAPAALSYAFRILTGAHWTSLSILFSLLASLHIGGGDVDFGSSWITFFLSSEIISGDSWRGVWRRYYNVLQLFNPHFA